MPNKRSRNKVMMAAQVNMELHRAVCAWVDLNPGRTISDFVVLAAVEKLKRDKVPFDEREAMVKRPPRRLVHEPSCPGSALSLNDAPAAAAEILEAVATTYKVSRKGPGAPPAGGHPESGGKPPPK